MKNQLTVCTSIFALFSASAFASITCRDENRKIIIQDQSYLPNCIPDDGGGAGSCYYGSGYGIDTDTYREFNKPAFFSHGGSLTSTLWQEGDVVGDITLTVTQTSPYCRSPGVCRTKIAVEAMGQSYQLDCLGWFGRID